MSPTPLLLVCLLIATALGAAIGVCSWHLYLTRRHERALASLQSMSQRSTDTSRRPESEQRADSDLAEQPVDTSLAVADLVERNRSLLTVSGDQRRRIELLESEVRRLEERHMKLQRDLASSRADRRELLGQSATGDLRPALPAMRFDKGALDKSSVDKVPVLNRRVAGGDTVRRGHVDAGRSSAEPGLDRDLDVEFPALSESELPATGNDLALDRLDVRLPKRQADD